MKSKILETRKPTELTDVDCQTIKRIFEKLSNEQKKSGSRFALISFEEFNSLLTSDEVFLVTDIMKKDPREFGFKGEFLGIKEVPNDLVALEEQKIIVEAKERVLPAAYIPRFVFNAFRQMNQAMENEIGKKLLIEDGYRSPAFQMFNFLFYLNLYDFSFDKTFSRVALPGYSEHGDPDHPAVDFITSYGSPSEDPTVIAFEKTKEYQWLKKNAGKFGFQESYPKDNRLGIIFEPWHWKFIHNS